MLDDLRDLYAYDRWANERTLDACLALAPEQYARDLGSSFASVRLTMEHILRAEAGWLSRWKGTLQGTPPDLSGCETPAALRARWEAFWPEQQEFLDGLDEARLRADAPFKLWSGPEGALPLHEQMRHVVNHSTYHRGQVTTMLRLLGAAGIGTDYLLWCGRRRGVLS